MKKLLLGLLAAALLLTTVCVAPAVAGTTSDGHLTVTTQDVSVWPDQCGNATYTIDSSFPGAASWNIDVTVYDPRGSEVAYDPFDDPTTSPSGSQSGTTQVCDYGNVVGTFRVVAEYTTYDADANQTGSGSVTSTFVLSPRSKYASVLRVARTPYGRHVWKISGALTRNGRWWSGHYVRIQVYAGGSWHSLRTSTTDRVGRIYFAARPTTRRLNRYWFRLHSTGGTYTRDANSVSFHLPKR